MIWRYKVTGVIRESGSGKALSGLVVRGYDKDLLFDDHLGDTRTDESGRFEIEFTDEPFRSPVDENPDVYLVVFDASGERELLSTIDQVRRNAAAEEHFELEIPADRLRGEV